MQLVIRVRMPPSAAAAPRPAVFGAAGATGRRKRGDRPRAHRPRNWPVRPERALAGGTSRTRCTSSSSTSRSGGFRPRPVRRNRQPPRWRPVGTGRRLRLGIARAPERSIVRGQPAAAQNRRFPSFDARIKERSEQPLKGSQGASVLRAKHGGTSVRHRQGAGVANVGPHGRRAGRGPCRVAAAHVLGDVGAFTHDDRPRRLAVVGRGTRVSG